MTTIAAFLFLIAIHGYLLQVAVALTGEAAPRYGEAAATALLAGLVSGLATFGFRFSAGLVLWAFFGSTAVWAVAMAVGWLATVLVYRRRLEVPLGHALLVALLHHGMAWLVSGGVWFAVQWVG